MNRINLYSSDMTFNFSAAGGVPVGTYSATLESIERTHHEEYGPGVRLTWRVCEGAATGMLVSRTCGVYPNAVNAAGRLMSGVMGRKIAPGEKVTLSECLGRKYRIVVGLNSKGSTRVDSCTPE